MYNRNRCIFVAVWGGALNLLDLLWLRRGQVLATLGWEVYKPNSDYCQLPLKNNSSRGASA